MVEISRRVVVPIHSSHFTSSIIYDALLKWKIDGDSGQKMEETGGNVWDENIEIEVTEGTDDAEGEGEEVQGGVVELGGVDSNDNRGVILLAADDGEFAQFGNYNFSHLFNDDWEEQSQSFLLNVSTREETMMT